MLTINISVKKETIPISLQDFTGIDSIGSKCVTYFIEGNYNDAIQAQVKANVMDLLKIIN